VLKLLINGLTMNLRVIKEVYKYKVGSQKQM